MKNKSLGEKIFYFFNVTLLSILCISILYPYLYVLSVSFNDSSKSVNSGLMLWPKVFTIINYKILLSDSSILHALFVTLARILLSLALQLTIAFTSSYALTRKGLPYKKTIVMFFFIPSYISGGLIPGYILFSWLHLLNNFWVYVLPVSFSFYFFILLRTYMTTIPDSLEESARIDGASDFRIMMQIFFPLCLPMIVTLSLLIIVSCWNDWTTTLYYMSNDKWNTLAFELYRILQQQARLAALIQEAVKHGQVSLSASTSSEGLRNAQIIITTIPIIAVYPFLQKYFIKGLLIGGVKE